MRAIATRFPVECPQHWRLYDHDERLLESARVALSAWADHADERDGALHLIAQERHLHISFLKSDLNRDIDGIPRPGDIVTASAFFDLVSKDWMERLAGVSLREGASLYAALTYDGRRRWDPPHLADLAMLSAFNLHQRSDKGFGRAAGPRAAALLAAALQTAGFHVETADSTWRLSSSDHEVMRSLARGCASAVIELNAFDPPIIQAWLGAKEADVHCEIGHTDILAVPFPGIGVR